MDSSISVSPTHHVYVCMESESTDEYRDEVDCFAVVNSIHAARVACRDKAMQRKDEYFTSVEEGMFDGDRERELWKHCFMTGSYDNAEWQDSKHRYKIWFKEQKMQNEEHFPVHAFEASDASDAEGDDDEGAKDS